MYSIENGKLLWFMQFYYELRRVFYHETEKQSENHDFILCNKIFCVNKQIPFRIFNPAKHTHTYTEENRWLWKRSNFVYLWTLSSNIIKVNCLLLELNGFCFERMYLETLCIWVIPNKNNQKPTVEIFNHLDIDLYDVNVRLGTVTTWVSRSLRPISPLLLLLAVNWFYYFFIQSPVWELNLARSHQPLIYEGTMLKLIT